MAPDFKTLLATEVINDQKTLSYRNVSRALKVHVNAAKCMLYEFHKRENQKNPGSVYATYLISGIKKRPTITITTREVPPAANGSDVPIKIDGDDDTEMAVPSSPPPFPSSMPSASFAASQKVEQAELPERLQVNIRTITLVREEDLEKVQAEYEKITAMHVYSLSPGRIPDLQVLTDASRALFADVFVKEDPLVHNKTYGVIQNPYVRRRSGKRPTNIQMPVPKAQVPTNVAKSGPVTTKNEPSRPSSRDSTSTHESKGAKPKVRRDPASLFKAFAKQSAKSSLQRQDTDASAASGSGADTDTKMLENDDEGESEDEALFLDTNTKKEGKKRPSDVAREREERQAKLRKMMDEDDAEEAKAASETKAEPPTSNSANPPELPKEKEEGEEQDVAWSDSDGETTAKEKKAEQAPVQPSRRRGRRKVIKKKQTKDEDGYLVTREEEVWESFSEDEMTTSQPKAKPAFPSKSQNKGPSGNTVKSSATQGTKKKGDIMSFFGKK